MTSTRILLSPPHMAGEERRLLLEAFDSNWIAPLGPQVDAFERELAETVGARCAAALSSGTAALHLALRLVGVGPGDEVICPTLTFIATANPVIYQGARPVFVDVSPETWTLDPDLLEEELAERARNGRSAAAVIAVDLYGQCADYGALESICDRYRVPLLEDAAEALGSRYRDRRAGAFGRAGVFSFNGNKILTTSGGGALVSDDRELVDKARFLASQAREPFPHYQHEEIGYNYRLSNLLAAVGRGQLRGLGDRVADRRRLFLGYRRRLENLPGLTFMPEADYGRSNRWLTVVSIDRRRFGADREEVRRALETRDIEARPVWKPLHLQPVFANAARRGGRIAEALFRDGLCLPSGSGLTDGQQDEICSVIRDVHRRRPHSRDRT
jgi:dTDP-4-amino-4,6-dideoxygalactose transaminase